MDTQTSNGQTNGSTIASDAASGNARDNSSGNANISDSENSCNSVKKYGWDSGVAPNSCNYIVPQVVSLLKELNVRRVLDLGSGNGALCFFLKKECFDVVGVECDTEGCGLASSNCPEVRFYNYGVHDNPSLLMENEKAFDAVVSTEVIEHLFSPHLLPVYAGAVLKNNGYLVISTPYHGYIKNLVLSVLNKWDKHWSPLWHGGHIKFWSRKTLTQLLEQNGFKVMAFYGVGRFPLLWKSMILVAAKV